jgi:hypothetical protein
MSDAPIYLGKYPFTEIANNNGISVDNTVISIEITDKARTLFNKMKGNTVKLYLHLIILKNKEDKYVYFKDREDYMVHNGIKADLTIRSCIKELVENKLIAYTTQSNIFWINHNYVKC